MRGGAVRERGGINCPDHRGGAGSGIGSTCAGRVRVTHYSVPIRPVAIPSLALASSHMNTNHYPILISHSNLKHPYFMV